jgi:hypothetical protein
MKAQIKVTVAFAIAITALLAKPVIAQANNKALEKRIVIHAREIRVDALLKLFSKQTGIEFSYNSSKVSPSKKLAVPKQSITLAEWLVIFRQTFGADHKLAGNHVILIDRHQQSNTNRRNIDLKATQQKPVTRRIKGDNVFQKTKDKEAGNIAKHQEHVPPANLQNAGASININNISPVDSGTVNHNLLVNDETTTVATANVDQIGKPVTSSNAPVQRLSDEATNTKRDVQRGTYKKSAIQLIGGYSLHGSGDMKGIVFGTECINYLTRRFSLNYNIKATINSSKDEYLVTNNTTGTTTDASIRYTTAGVQLGVNAGISIIKSIRHELKISLGAFGRYQSASNGSDGYSAYYPPITGVPTVLIGYDNRTPQETVAVGGILQFQYDFTFGNKVYIGVIPGFQTDTNGDAIPQVALTVGRRL